jgi:hypothetical protein
MNETQTILGKKKMLKMRMHLRSNRNESMAFLIKGLARDGAVFMMHNGNPSSLDTKTLLRSYRDFSVVNDKNLPKIFSGEKILHFNAEMVDIPTKARPKL